MAGSVNKVILIGHLGKDPEVRTTQAGGKIASLSLATSESWKDKRTGDRVQRTEWHRISIFNENLVKIVDQYCKKGSKLYVEGALQTRKWQDQQGQDRYTTEVVIQAFGGSITLLDSRDDREDRGGRDDDYGAGSEATPPPERKPAATAKQTYERDPGEEIPF